MPTKPHPPEDMYKDFGKCSKCGRKLFLADMDAAEEHGLCIGCYIGALGTDEEYTPRKKKNTKLPYWKKSKTKEAAPAEEVKSDE